MVCTCCWGYAQEVCGNDIDDDGNGLIDCYDPACYGSTPPPDIRLFNMDFYCDLDTNYQLQALPYNGYFTGPGVSGGYYNPSHAGVGPHTVTYTVVQGACTYTKDTILTTIGFPIADAGPDKTVCINTPVQLGTDSVPGAMYFWIWPTNLNSFQLAQPTGIYDSVGTYTYIMYVVVHGCHTTDTVSVTSTTVGNANAHLDWETCVTDTLIQFGNGTPSGGIWRGYGVVDSVLGKFSPSAVGVGAHPVTYNTWQVCPATDTLIVKVLGLADADITADTTICAGQQVQLEATGGYMFFWEPTTYLNDAGVYVGNPISSTPVSITYTVTVMNDTTCPGMDSVRITVLPPPIAGFSVDTVCVGTASTITDLASPNGLSYTWHFGDGSIAHDTANSHMYSHGGSYLVTQIVQVGNCSDTATAWAAVDHQPVADFTVDDACEGIQTFINDLSQAQGPADYTWHMGDGNTVNDSIGSYLYNNPGSYEVMQVINLGKCVDTATKYVLISDAPLADFDYTLVDSQTVAFNNNTQGGTSWDWLFGDGNGSNTQNPNHHYNNTGNYNVWLVAVNNSGCTDSALQVITIPSPIDTALPEAIKDALFIPNAFSPNGDGNNDVWKVFTNANINYFALTIYNRWGEKVYESNNQSQGWDGTYKGQLQTPQSYVFILGVVLQTGERRAYKGSLLLMK